MFCWGWWEGNGCRGETKESFYPTAVEVWESMKWCCVALGQKEGTQKTRLEERKIDQNLWSLELFFLTHRLGFVTWWCLDHWGLVSRMIDIVRPVSFPSLGDRGAVFIHRGVLGRKTHSKSKSQLHSLDRSQSPRMNRDGQGIQESCPEETSKIIPTWHLP